MMDRITTLILAPAVIFSCFCLQGCAYQTTGGWGEWSPMSVCSKSCDQGIQTRWREWIPGEGEEPLEKPYTNTEQYSCFEKPCPQNGSWSEWGMWGECTVGCGGGIRKRHRDCTNPPPAYGGSECEGHKFDEEECKKTPCPPLPANFNISVCKQSGMFMCVNQRMCVKDGERCDDTPHCNDGTDELECRRHGSGYRLGRIRYSRSDSARPTSVIALMATSVVAAFLFVTLDC